MTIVEEDELIGEFNGGEGGGKECEKVEVPVARHDKHVCSCAIEDV